MLPDASAWFAPLVFALSAVAIVYTSLVALMQSDMKKLIAYSSVAHMGIVTIGIFTPNAVGVTGSIVQMLSHGFVSGALFMLVGVIYDRIHSREIARYGGLASGCRSTPPSSCCSCWPRWACPAPRASSARSWSSSASFQHSSWVAVFATSA
jgi:NADH-quinone oxidoreductase subunit M